MGFPVHVFLIHRYRLLTDALGAALAHDPEIVLAGRADSFAEAGRRLAELDVDVVLAEADLDRARSRPAIRQLRSAFPEIKIVPMGLDSTVRVLECIEAGASGYLRLDVSLAEFVETLKQIEHGRAPCPPELAASMFARVAELARRGEERAPATHFTPREKQVLELLVMGLANKEIAGELGLAVATVKNHVHRILEKLGVRRRREAIRLAHETELLDRLGRS